MTPLEIEIPKLQTVSGNTSIKANRFANVRKAKAHRQAASIMLLAEDMCRVKSANADEWQGCLAYATGAPITVTVTRCSAGALDEHDNLRTALKHVVDGVADFLGCDDDDERITWNYAQEKAKRGTHAVRIKIEVRPL